ncbi:divalent-cation tolerance protein CutA [Cerasicoccus maritimus]|uniref:divalent-cation tolerance protein CutA n=1 Tax=Cerasicoccus maritimus TaxID=490089 RepID=UPI002852C63E|nr:divalent-cation tolerance protein CutA [Cerasicoccus maritimus]
MNSETQVAIGWSTTPSRELAVEIGRALVEQRLVACAQVTGPVTSIYQWQGDLCQEEEFRLVLKFPADHEGAVRNALVALHPYDTPQWVVTYADTGSTDYVAWVHDSQREDAP